jgi:hypothetical protein
MWLVLAAIPLKGMAVSVLAACTGHQQSLYSKATTSHPCHDHGAEADTDASFHHPQNHDQGHSDTSHLKCSACSSCCAGSSIASSGFVQLPEFKTPFYIFYHPPQHRAPDLNRLDRPPRQHLA